MSQLPTNPNVNRNRAPQVGELVSLRATLSHIQSVVDHNVHAVEVAQEAYDAITVQDNTQIMVLEGIQSELHAAKNSVDALRRVAVSLEPNLQEFHGFLHPICRYPDDILRLVFEEHVRGTKWPFSAAITLSHVCQGWRKMALSTPTLWKQVTITSKPTGGALKSQAAAFVTRVGRVPTTITIDIDVDYMSTLAAIKCVKAIPFDLLYATPVISTLELLVSHELENPTFLFDAIEHFPHGDFGTLFISLDSYRPASFRPEAFISKFPRFRSLKLEQCCLEVTISPYLGPILSLIVELSLFTISTLAITELLRLTRKHLQKLIVRVCDLVPSSDPHTGQCVMVDLLYLSATGPGFPWNQIQCPKLTYLEVPLSTDGLKGEHFWQFCSNTESITSAKINLDGGDLEQLTRLARSTPRLQTLQIQYPTSDDIASIFVRHDGLDGPPFPDLLHLTFIVVEGTFKADVLDDLIQRRCFPKGHPESMLDPGVTSALEGFEMKAKSETDLTRLRCSRYLAKYFRMRERESVISGKYRCFVWDDSLHR